MNIHRYTISNYMDEEMSKQYYAKSKNTRKRVRRYVKKKGLRKFQKDLFKDLEISFLFPNFVTY